MVTPIFDCRATVVPHENGPEWEFFLPDEVLPDEEESLPEPGDFWIDAADEDEG